MVKEWALDRKSRQERPAPTRPKTVRLTSYVEAQRKKIKSTHNVTRLKTQLRAAKAHLKTLEGRAHFRERKATQEFIRDTETRIAEMAKGTCRDMSEFEAVVQPYLDMVQQLEQKPTREEVTHIRKPVSLDDAHAHDESSIQAELALQLNDTVSPVYVVDEDMCDTCNVPMVVMASEARMGCPLCSRTRSYMQATSSRIPYGEEVEFGSFSYKRQNHFQEWLNSIQAKENTEVSGAVIERVMAHLYRNGVRNPQHITLDNVRAALKALDLRKVYDHTMQLYVTITGNPPPRFTTFQEEQLRLMFDAIQGPFKKHCPPERKNFLSYAFCLHKFCELLGYDHFLQYFTLLKGAEKLRKQDAIFAKICEELDWQFIPSYKDREAACGTTLEHFVKR
jgi:hypothetical protein